MFVRASIGIAITPRRRADASELLRDADLAMYTAKRDGKSRLRACSRRACTPRRWRGCELAADLQRALDSDQFALVYQPMVELGDRPCRRRGAAALASTPTRGVIAPAEFIPAAEETGLIVPIGAVGAERGLPAGRGSWQGAVPASRSSTMAVNVSARQLDQGDFVGEVRRAIRTAASTRRCVLEITESVLMMTRCDPRPSGWRR